MFRIQAEIPSNRTAEAVTAGSVGLFGGPTIGIATAPTATIFRRPGKHEYGAP